MEIKEIIKKLLEENSLQKTVVYDLYADTAESYPEAFTMPNGKVYKKNSWDRLIRKVYREMTEGDPLIKKAVDLERQNQLYQDKNRIQNKLSREVIRTENALLEYNRHIKSCLESIDLTDVYIPPDNEISNTESVGIVHLTDHHYNELVNTKANKYDFEIASKRLKKLKEKSKSIFDSKNITDVVIVITGDMVNSDRRLDEILSMASNRARATLMAVYLLEHFILDLAEDYNIFFTGIVGNESRAKQELGFTDLLATDNYDYTILEFLKILFKDIEDVNYIKPNDYNESVINILGSNILFLHGHTANKDTEKWVQALVGKYSTTNDINIDYVIYGHIHATLISSMSARGGSLVGGNDYSDISLNYTSKASQNILIVSSNGDIDTMAIDLQNYDDIEGYDIFEQLKEYKIRSCDELDIDNSKILSIGG